MLAPPGDEPGGVSVSESGCVIAPAVTADILRLAKSETVTAETNENGLLTLTFGNSRYELPTVAAESFPKCNISFPQSYITVRGLGELLRKSAFAAERQGEMQSVQCVRIKLDAEKSRCEATDTKRMAMAESSTAADGSLELLLHISAVNIIEALSGCGTVYVGTSPPLAVFIAENTVFATLMLCSDSVKISIDRNGFMLLESADGKYMVTPRKKAVIKEPKKTAEKKSAEKKKKAA